MTDYGEIDRKCSVCGKTSKQFVIFSSSHFGSRDLDTKASRIGINTMKMWVMECPYCGYVANQLSEDLKINKDFLKTEKYKTCDGINFKSIISERFYKEYLIKNVKKDNEKAYSAILHCAWACDDTDDLKNSKHARTLAVKLADKIIKNYKPVSRNIEFKNQADFRRKINKKYINNIIVMKADLLRRIGEFDRLIQEYENLTLDDELLNKIIRFQVKKARKKDKGCYTLNDLSIK